MAILVRPTKTTLAWSDFVETRDSLQDHEAEAGYDSGFVPANFTPQRIRGRAYLPATYTIRVWPVARVAPGANRTTELLAHEQFHYDVGIICARALARDLEGLNGSDPSDLLAQLTDLHVLHMLTRAGAIQDAYDSASETDHGRNADKQRDWQAAMAECLARPSINRIMGLPL